MDLKSSSTNDCFIPNEDLIVLLFCIVLVLGADICTSSRNYTIIRYSRTHPSVRAAAMTSKGPMARDKIGLA